MKDWTVAITMSERREEFHASQMKKPMPTPPVSISAATMASQLSPMPIRKPVKIYGAAAGTITLKKNSIGLNRRIAATFR